MCCSRNLRKDEGVNRTFLQYLGEALSLLPPPQDQILHK